MLNKNIYLHKLNNYVAILTQKKQTKKPDNRICMSLTKLFNNIP